LASVVLDASAFLAYLFDEPGAETVVEAISEGACMSTVNYSEVLSRLVDRGVPVEDALRDLTGRGLRDAIELLDFDVAVATEAARLRDATRNAGLSLGDRACIATALVAGLPVLTADATWQGVGLSVDVRLIR
jgi:ribonuclease VapC